MPRHRNNQTVATIIAIAATSRSQQVMVAQTAPAVRVAIGEELGLPPGSVSTGQMVAALKALGFDYVFDTGAGRGGGVEGFEGLGWLEGLA